MDQRWRLKADVLVCNSTISSSVVVGFIHCVIIINYGSHYFTKNVIASWEWNPIRLNFLRLFAFFSYKRTIQTDTTQYAKFYLLWSVAVFICNSLYLLITISNNKVHLYTALESESH